MQRARPFAVPATAAWPRGARRATSAARRRPAVARASRAAPRQTRSRRASLSAGTTSLPRTTRAGCGGRSPRRASAAGEHNRRRVGGAGSRRAHELDDPRWLGEERRRTRSERRQTVRRRAKLELFGARRGVAGLTWRQYASARTASSALFRSSMPALCASAQPRRRSRRGAAACMRVSGYCARLHGRSGTRPSRSTGTAMLAVAPTSRTTHGGASPRPRRRRASRPRSAPAGRPRSGEHSEPRALTTRWRAGTQHRAKALD